MAVKSAGGKTPKKQSAATKVKDLLIQNSDIENFSESV